MRSRRWGLIAVIALVMAAVLLSITWIWGKDPETTASVTLTATREGHASPFLSPTATQLPPEPITYTVQAGDTLSAIAQEHDVSLEALTTANDLIDPDVLRIGQILIIPRNGEETLSSPAGSESPPPSSSTEEESLIAPPTMTPSGPSLVEISTVTGVGVLQAETVALVNRAGMVDLEAWTLSGSDDDRFIFPALTLLTQGEVQVHSADGTDTPRDLYWGRTESAWQEGELVILRDADGNVVDTYVVPD